MKTVAFLQNAWFPADRLSAIRAAYLRHGHTPESRARLTARYLFYRCPTGKRLKAAFGDLCDRIIWEEASPEVAGESSGVFPPDPKHMASVVQHFRPDVVLAFGKVAQSGVAAMRLAFSTSPVGDFTIISGPHPVARHAGCIRELDAMADRLRAIADGNKADAAGRTA
jgi:hypothetical protein